MIDFIEMKWWPTDVSTCSYCGSVVADTERHREFHDDAEPGPDAAGSDYDHEEGPAVPDLDLSDFGVQDLNELVELITAQEWLPLNVRYQAAARILRAGWHK